jgi:hypothetical protein
MWSNQLSALEVRVLVFLNYLQQVLREKAGCHDAKFIHLIKALMNTLP